MSEEFLDIESFSENDLNKIRSKYFNENLKGLINKVSSPKPSDEPSSREDVLREMHELFYRVINLRYLPDAYPDAIQPSVSRNGRKKSKYDYFKQETLNLLDHENRTARNGRNHVLLQYRDVFTNESLIMMNRLYRRLIELAGGREIVHYTRDRIIIIDASADEVKRLLEKEALILDHSLEIREGRIQEFL